MCWFLKFYLLTFEIEYGTTDSWLLSPLQLDDSGAERRYVHITLPQFPIFFLNIYIINLVLLKASSHFSLLLQATRVQTLGPLLVFNT